MLRSRKHTQEMSNTSGSGFSLGQADRGDVGWAPMINAGSGTMSKMSWALMPSAY